ncbi:MAG TPA: response regulator [Candidatus Thermoplasmatota archaeon]|jgi:CheY-like chemotaxis protein|nr:response regulator [Candidatus Thermoplasmatota archaeon]
MATAERVRVLHVENDPYDAAQVAAALRRAPFPCEVTVVDGRAKLVAALAQGAWDIALLDYAMPFLNVAEAIAILRAHAPGLPYVIVSGKLPFVLDNPDTASLADPVWQALKLGRVDYVSKYNLTRLGAVLEANLRGARTPPAPGTRRAP